MVVRSWEFESPPRHLRKKLINKNKKLQAYIVGLSLGDGNLSNPNGRAVRLRITCDKKYPLLIKHIKSCVELLLPQNKINIVNKKRNCIDISTYSNYWSKLLWQWDKGSKDKQNVFIPNWIKNNSNLSKDVFKMMMDLGYSPNLQKLKQKNGKIKHTIRLTKNAQKFIKDINLWEK